MKRRRQSPFRPFRVTVPAGTTVGRPDLTQRIGAGVPAGVYTFNAYVGQFPNTVLDSGSFTFEKLAVGSRLPR